MKLSSLSSPRKDESKEEESSSQLEELPVSEKANTNVLTPLERPATMQRIALSQDDILPPPSSSPQARAKNTGMFSFSAQVIPKIDLMNKPIKAAPESVKTREQTKTANTEERKDSKANQEKEESKSAVDIPNKLSPSSSEERIKRVRKHRSIESKTKAELTNQNVDTKTSDDEEKPVVSLRQLARQKRKAKKPKSPQ